MSARYTERGADRVYAVAQEWANCALRADGSLFTPGKPIWTPELLGELHQRFLNQPDESSRSFLEKLETQLTGRHPELGESPAEVYQLMGEVLYVHYLPRSETDALKKNAVETALGWSPSPVAIPQKLADVFQDGFVGVGPGRGLIPFWAGTLIESLEQWKKLDPNDREQLLNDPWQFKDFLFGRSFESQLLKPAPNKGGAQRHLLLHILFPDTFERILANDKGNICKAKAFAKFIDPQEPDVDRKIQQIRQGIEAKLGKDFDFYDPCIVKYWKGDSIVDDFCAGGKVSHQNGESLKDLADRLYLPVGFLQEIEQLLAERRQVIFQGPPGTGKTFVARELAGFLAGGDADADKRVTLVQFHPSYAYEDFVQGYRPTLTAGQAGFELRDGPLLRAAERAQDEPAAKHYLIIDEINRGNLAAVFGELYFLLEYRDERINLQYSDAGFSLPENLFILGTMNTADRSIALVDLALRRRFYFVEFRPDEEPVKGVLRQWLQKNAPQVTWVDGVVKRANELLSDSDAALGPSYFMQDNLTADKVALIWKHSVLPYIEERLYGSNDDVLANFALERLKGQVSSQPEEVDTTDSRGAAGNEPDGSGV